MRILFLGNYNPSEKLSGPEKAAKRIFSEISKENNVFFIEYFFKGKKGRNLINIFLGYEEAGNNILRLGLIRQILFFIKFKPEIIHIIAFQRFTLTAFIYKLFFSPKIVYTVHGIIKYENSLKKVSFFYKLKDSLLEIIVFKYSDRLLFFSEPSVEIAKKYFKVKKNKILFIANGADEIFYLQPSLYSSDKLRLVFIGDIKRKEKDFDFLLSALKEVKAEFTLDVISETKNDNLLKEKNYLKFHEPMSTLELSSFLSERDMIISVSTFETFSISTLEGMAAGLIPVVTQNTGISKFIRNNENGFIIKQGDKENLVNILENLSADIEERKRISCKAREIFILLNWKNISEDHLRIYKSVLS